MPVRLPRGHSGATEFRMQKSPRQVSQAPCPQRPDSSFLCFSWSPTHKGVLLVVPDGREATRWSDTRPWQSGRSMCWDVTVICPLAESYVSGAAIEAGAAAEVAASRKEAKYADLGSRYSGATWRIRLTVHVRPRCGLLSNYFDHLLLLSSGLSRHNVRIV